MQLGFADSRLTGPCFQWMSSHDISSFVSSVDNAFLDCDRGCKSIISDSDLESTTCNYPAWGRADDDDILSTSSSRSIAIHPAFLPDPASKSATHSANMAMWRLNSTPSVPGHADPPAVDRENIRQALQCYMFETTATTGPWLRLLSDVDAEILYPEQGKALELARVDPWQLGNPVGNADVIHVCPDRNAGLQKASLIVVGQGNIENALNEHKGFLSET